MEDWAEIKADRNGRDLERIGGIRGKALVEFHRAFPSMLAPGYFTDNPDPL